jgi:hypothetical protein
MTRALTRLDQYWALVGAIAYTIVIGLVFGYVSAIDATSALVVYLGAAVFMAPPIAFARIAQRGAQIRRRAIRREMEQLRDTLAEDPRDVDTPTREPYDAMCEVYDRMQHVIERLRSTECEGTVRSAEKWRSTKPGMLKAHRHADAADEPLADESIELLQEQAARLHNLIALEVERQLRSGKTAEQIAAAHSMTVEEVNQLRAHALEWRVVDER